MGTGDVGLTMFNLGSQHESVLIESFRSSSVLVYKNVKTKIRSCSMDIIFLLYHFQHLFPSHSKSSNTENASSICFSQKDSLSYPTLCIFKINILQQDFNHSMSLFEVSKIFHMLSYFSKSFIFKREKIFL